MEIDTTLRLNWKTAEYIGDGVYAMDVTEHQGHMAMALRTDRIENGSNVIVLDLEMVKTLHTIATNIDYTQRHPKSEDTQ